MSITLKLDGIANVPKDQQLVATVEVPNKLVLEALEMAVTIRRLHFLPDSVTIWITVPLSRYSREEFAIAHNYLMPTANVLLEWRED